MPTRMIRTTMAPQYAHLEARARDILAARHALGHTQTVGPPAAMPVRGAAPPLAATPGPRAPTQRASRLDVDEVYRGRAAACTGLLAFMNGRTA